MTAGLPRTLSDVPIGLAHGLGDAADLPLPFGIVLWGAGAAVLGVAALVSARSREPGAHADAAGLRLPAAPARLADHAVTRAAAQAALLLLLVAVVALAALGPDRAATNPAPRLVYALFWGGLVPLSLLFGPVWRAANPVRLLAAGLARVSGDPHDLGARPVPAGTGVWPAAALLGVFVWGELALPAQPRPTALVVTALVLATLAATARHGRAWLAHGDPFEVYSGALGALAPLGRGASGRLLLRSPRAALARLASPPGLGGVVAVVVGADLFDGVSERLAWQNAQVGLEPAVRVLVDSAGLAACVLAAGLLVWAGTRGARELVPAFLPVAAGYAVAHYGPVLLVETQTVAAQLSDPLGRGWDLFGTAGAGASYDVLPGAVVAIGLLAALVAGHAAAVVVAQDRVSRRGGPRAASARQLPLRAVLVASVLVSVTLRFTG